jgi:type II secretory pathway pseudopilin PulG
MLMALAMVAMMIIASTVVMTNMRTQAKRARERQMVWRGKQYVTAIKRFYRRSGRYPQDLDDLQKGVANIHFLRQAALKDPMNTDEDGKWRFIYTNASGQIIGSVRYATMQQMALLDLYGGKIPGAQGNSSASSDSSDNQANSNGTGPNGTGLNGTGSNETGSNPTGSNETGSNVISSPDQGSSTAANQNCPPASNPAPASNMPSGFPGGIAPGGIANGLGAAAANGAASLQSQFGQSSADSVEPINQPEGGQTACPQVQAGFGASSIVGAQLGMQQAALEALMSMKPTGPVDSPVIGGFLVGVGSTVDLKSVRIYKGGKNYKDWEFIWNPLEEQALAMQQAMGQGGGTGGMGLGGLTNPAQPNGSGMPGMGNPGGAMGGPGAGPMQASPQQPPQTPQQDPQ